MNEALWRGGEAEGFKGGVHVCLLGLTVMALGYNAMAFSIRRERHLALNVGVYAALVAFEWAHVRHHLRSRV